MAVRKALLLATACVLVCCSNASSNTTIQVTTVLTSTVKQTTAPTSAAKQTTAPTSAAKQTTAPTSNNQLSYINGDLVRLINNCTVGVSTSCPYNYCCTKKYMTYYAGYLGSMPVYQLECKPLRKSGEFCYFKNPEQFCPCASRCHTNGFYGSCL